MTPVMPEDGGGLPVPQAVDPLALSEAAVAALCHDLSGPLGTLASALELAEEDPAAAGEALPLAREAALRMTKRLRLVRAAWGGACGALSRAALLDLADGLPPRVSVDANELGGQTFEGPVARVLLNAVLTAAMALPRGGCVALAGASDRAVTVMPQGADARWPAGMLLALGDPMAVPLMDPHAVQLPMLASLAAAAGMRASLLMPAGIAAPGCPPLLLTRLT